MMRGAFLCLVTVATVIQASSVCVNQPCAPQNVVADYVFLIDTSNAFETYQFAAIKDMLKTWTSTLTISAQKSRVALYSYGNKAVSAGTFTALSDPTALSAAIDKLKQEDTVDRNLADVIALEEKEVTGGNGLRASAEKVLVVLAGDSWSGTDVFTPTLEAARSKFDAIQVIGVGVQPIDNGFLDFRKLAGVDSYVFWAFDVSQLPYAGLWLTKNGCQNAHVDPTTLAPTVMPTPAGSIGCNLQNLDLDIYLVVDTSSSMPAADFAAMKQSLSDFVSVFPLGAKQTQFGLVTTYADSQLFYTGLGTTNVNRRALLHTIEQLQQEVVDGQTLKLSLQAIESVYLKSTTASRKLIVYYTGNTKWDQDPTSYMASLTTNYRVKSLAVKWTNSADITKLASFTGALRCAIDGSVSSNRPGIPTLIETKICSDSWCRS